MTRHGPVSSYLNRPLAASLARGIQATPLAPAHVIALAIVVAAAAAGALAAGWNIPGAVAIQVVNVLDGVGHELARLRDRTSRLDPILNAAAGRYADLLVFGGLTAHAVRFEDHPRPEFIGALALGAVLIVSYSRARIEADLPDVAARPNLDAIFRFAGRDALLLIAAIGALFGQCYLALVAVAATSALTIAWRLLYLRITIGGRRLPPA